MSMFSSIMSVLSIAHHVATQAGGMSIKTAIATAFDTVKRQWRFIVDEAFINKVLVMV